MRGYRALAQVVEPAAVFTVSFWALAWTLWPDAASPQAYMGSACGSGTIACLSEVLWACCDKVLIVFAVSFALFAWVLRPRNTTRERKVRTKRKVQHNDTGMEESPQPGQYCRSPDAVDTSSAPVRPALQQAAATVQTSTLTRRPAVATASRSPPGRSGLVRASASPAASLSTSRSPTSTNRTSPAAVASTAGNPGGSLSSGALFYSRVVERQQEEFKTRRLCSDASERRSSLTVPTARNEDDSASPAQQIPTRSLTRRPAVATASRSPPGRLLAPSRPEMPSSLSTSSSSATRRTPQPVATRRASIASSSPSPVGRLPSTSRRDQFCTVSRPAPFMQS
jgi:hypothetical protein